MKKICILLVMLISVLNIWGQNEFDINSYSIEIHELRELNSTVLAQDYVKNQTKEWVDKTTELLDSLFQTAEDLIHNYGSLSNDDKRFVDGLLKNFCDEYKKAIYNTERTKVLIESNKFEKCARKYKDSFDVLVKQQHKKSNAKIKSQSEPIQQEESQEGYLGEEETSEVEEYSKTQVILIAMAGILGVLSVVALFLCIWLGTQVSSLRKKISKVEGEMQRMELARINKEQKSKASKNNTTSTPTVPTTSTTSTLPSNQNKKNNPPQPSKHDVAEVSQPSAVTTLQKTVKSVVEQPIYLYALANANSTDRDFYKASDKDSQDKVFRLCLKNAGDEVATFTIKPNVMRDFILEHEIYLPTTYCNKKEIKSTQPTAIEVIDEGKAEKSNGKWIVSKPMSIRLV